MIVELMSKYKTEKREKKIIGWEAVCRFLHFHLYSVLRW